MTKSLEHTIKARYSPGDNVPSPPPTFCGSILDVHEMAGGMITALTDIVEDASGGDPSDPTTTKKGLAIMIAGALNRVVDGSNPVNTNYLLAALALLQLSTGDDQLMTVARRLAVKGMTPKTKKKLKEDLGESINYKHRAIDDAHAAWNADIDHTVKMSEGGIGNLDRYRGSKEQIAKVKEFVDKHPYNRVPNALKMADHAGISDGLAAHLHKALKAVTESGRAKEKPFTQADRIGRYLSDQRGRPRR